MSRPTIEFTEKQWEQISQMAHIQCTGEEIASVMGCSYDTLDRRVKERYEQSFADWINEKKQGGKASLRRMQWKTANSGNVTMQIFLGKNMLGQSDKLESKTEVKQHPDAYFGKIDDPEQES